ncbi:radical SAM protein [Candidatus Omnitrophota bacterium]
MKFRIHRYYNFFRSYFHAQASYLIFFVTSKCNARCKMCFYWQEIEQAKAKNTLALGEIERIAKGFKRLAYLTLTGGEPVLREDLDKIAYQFYKHSGTRFIAFSTNGLLPERAEAVVESILEKCPGVILKANLSIDHIGDRHDQIRGVSGSFDKALETYSRLKQLKRKHPNFSIVVATVLSSFNKAEIFQIIDYVQERIAPDTHSIDLARGNTKEQAAREVSLEEYKEVIDYVKNKSRGKTGLFQTLLELMMEVIFQTLKKDRMVLPCVAGRRMLTLTDDGLIVPCEMLNQISPERDSIMGDLRKNNYDIKAILNTQKSKSVVNWIKRSNCYCTFECATSWNIVFNPKMYPKICKRLLTNGK